MEEVDECSLYLNVHQDEKRKDESKIQTDFSDVSLRQNCANEKDAVAFPVNSKTDSLALLSVYRYAKKIKSFLGWESTIEESELEEETQNYVTQNSCLRKESCSSDSETSYKNKQEFTDENLIKGEPVSENNDEVSCEDHQQNNSSLDGTSEDILDENSERIPHQRTFRSEVSIYVEDCRSKIILSMPKNSVLEDCMTDRNKSMSEPLVQERDTTHGGIHLNDDSNILKDGLYVGSSSSVYEMKNVLEDNVVQKDDNEVEVERNNEPKQSGCNENKEHSFQNSLVNNADKLVDHLVKEKQPDMGILQKSDRSLKAHIQYEDDIKQQNATYNDDTECGFSIFRPRWLQKYATAKMYVILYSILGVLHGSYYSYLIGTLSTLEKRYTFKSKISGAVMVADELTPLLLGVIIGYYAGKANRPRMIALGMLLSAGCCFCSSLPYFIYGPTQSTTIQNVQIYAGPMFCDSGSEQYSCDLDGRPPTLPAVLFLVLGSFLKGFGNLAYYAIGLAYLDDNYNKSTTPIYLAIALALRLVGPLVGFLMSSAFLKLYENPAEDPGYGPEDPRWVGAWWIGFFLQGVLLVIFTLPIALFPRRLPGQRSVETNTAPTNDGGLKEIFMGLFLALKRLAKNRVFILLIVNTNMKIFGHFGHSIMLPKYMENQFRLSASEASLYSGATSITFVMLSTIFGGYMIWKFRPRIKILLGGMIISEVMLSVGFLILIIPRCQYADMMNFGINDEGLILNSPCNQMCDCSTTSYTPFCGPQGATYFSPCYAGCTQKLVGNKSSEQHKEFGNCSCVSSVDNKYLTPTISEGVCPDENCWSQALAYLIIYFFLLTISNTFTVAHSMILLRSVHPNDKSIALGTFETFICLFGFIPFPVTFGALVDSACLVWEKSCGETGNCWFYDMEKYSYLLHGVGALFCSFSALCLIGLYFLSGRVRDLYADEEDGKNEYVDIKLDTVSGSVTKL